MIILTPNDQVEILTWAKSCFYEYDEYPQYNVDILLYELSESRDLKSTYIVLLLLKAMARMIRARINRENLRKLTKNP